jgi:hypothetical protein
MDRNAEIAEARKADETIATEWDKYWTAVEPIAALRSQINQDRKMADYYWDRADRRARYEEKVQAGTARIEAIRAEAEPLKEAAIALNKELYQGWTRFFLVEHVHSSMNCSSFRPTTKVLWLPGLSGQTEAEAVAEHGAILCTICFPSAPVEWTRGLDADPSICTGAGKSTAEATSTRRGFSAGNWAECPDCGKKVGISNSAVKIPKHKKP